jgi:hypothetical protein
VTLEDVRDRIELEGFDYAFRFYSNFEDVADPEFHRLREAYVDAAQALDSYIPELEDDQEIDDEEVEAE